MKTRNFFVSNSSSSSFIVHIDNLNGDQFYKILNHKELNDLNYNDQWCVHCENSYIKGSCSMDNFSMREYMKDIGVDLSKVRFEYD